MLPQSLLPAVNRRVIVIGAGVSGLCGAYELNARGHDVIVLEAKSRPGGRIETLRERFADGLYADAGAMVFGDVNTNVKNYVEHFNLPIRAVPPGSSLYHLHGSQFVAGQQAHTAWPASLPLTPAERQMSPAALMEKYFIDGLPDVIQNPLAPGWPPDSLKPFDQMTAVEFLRSRGASDGAIEVFSIGLFALAGEGLASLSALSVLAIVAMAAQSRMAFWLPGGSDQLPRAFASALSRHICYGTAVTAVATTATGVTVTTAHGQTYDADVALCAVPFAVLTNIAFTPPLSAEKQQIANELGNTSVLRTFLQFRTRFWERDGESGTAFTDLGIGAIYSAYPLNAGRGVLETYAVGEDARRLGAMSEVERLKFALGKVSDIFPVAPTYYESGVSKYWNQDPWAAGGYAWFKPGQMLAFLPHLATTEGRVYFAGDATTSLPGWTEGALSAGRRAAQAIHASS